MTGIASRWFAIINPAAGSGKCLQDWPQISRLLREYGIVHDYAFTERKYHAIELAVDAINSGYRKVITVGGDGTMHEVVNGLFIQKQVPTQDILIGVIAVSASNDWIRMSGIPRKYSDAVRAIADGNSSLRSVGRISYYKSHYRQTRYMANVAGIGFDAFVNRKFNQLKEGGHKSKLLRLLNAMVAVLGYYSTRMQIRVDDGFLMEDNVYSAMIAIEEGAQGNVGSSAGNGLFEVAVIRSLGKLGVLNRFFALCSGKMGKLDMIALDKGRKIRIDSVPAVRVEVDGEAIGFSPLEFEILDDAINVVVLRKLLRN